MMVATMMLPLLSVVFGLILLVWSADRFVEGSAVTAKYLGMPPLLIGMIIVGFGTSAPEMLVSALSVVNGNPGIALGNAYGSNICNIAMILGITALIKPILVKSDILKKELPVLALVTLISIFLLMDGFLTRVEAAFLIFTFAGLLAWSLFQHEKTESDTLAVEVENKLENSPVSFHKAVFLVVSGLILLIVSSQILVTGSVKIARFFGGQRPDDRFDDRGCWNFSSGTGLQYNGGEKKRTRYCHWKYYRVQSLQYHRSGRSCRADTPHVN